MLRHKAFLYSSMFAIISCVFSINCSMNTKNTKIALNSKQLSFSVKEQQNISLPKTIVPQQLSVNIQQKKTINKGLLAAFSIIAGRTSQTAVAYTAFVQSAFSNIIGKNKAMKELSAEELNGMTIEQKRLAVGLKRVQQIKSDGTVGVTHDECNAIANMPANFKNKFKDITVKVPASRTDIALRVGGEVVSTVFPAVSAGAIIVGGVVAQKNNHDAQELHEQNKQIVYKDTYKQVFENKYIEEYEIQADEVVTKHACLNNLLAQFIIGTVHDNTVTPHGDNLEELGLSYGRKFKQQITEWQIPNPFQAFYKASLEKCYSKFGLEIRESASAIARKSAEISADKAAKELVKPSKEILAGSGVKKGVFYGFSLGLLQALVISGFKGHFSNPVFQEKVGNL